MTSHDLDHHEHDQRISRIKHLTALIKSTDHGDSVRHAAEHEGDRVAFHAHVDDLIDKHGEDHPLVQRGTQLREYVDHPQHQHPKYVQSAMADLHDLPVGPGSVLMRHRFQDEHGDWHPNTAVAAHRFAGGHVSAHDRPRIADGDGNIRMLSINDTRLFPGSSSDHATYWRNHSSNHATYWRDHPEDRNLVVYPENMEGIIQHADHLRQQSAARALTY